MMKNLKLLVANLILCVMPMQRLFSSNVNGSNAVIPNPNDVVRLVVSADGANKEEATKNALRSAIEQAYGTFVSANTTLLNNELVKDEIVTLSSGNIQSYKEVASALLPNGQTTVTLDAVVCISKLVNYAKSKGTSTEFAGATFAMNMKIKELNKKNEIIALDNLVKQFGMMLPAAFERKLEIESPKLPRLYNNFFMYEGKDIALNDDFLKNQYLITFNINFVPTEQYKTLRTYMINTLQEIALSEEELEEYWQLNIPTSYIEIYDPYQGLARHGIWIEPKKKLEFRCDEEEMYSVYCELNKIIGHMFKSFKIIDNLGNRSVLTDMYTEDRVYVGGGEGIHEGNGIFEYYKVDKGFEDKETPIFVYFSSGNILLKFLTDMDGSVQSGATVSFLIPQKDIDKYTNFTLEDY